MAKFNAISVHALRMEGDKGTAKQDWSVHVEFLTDQNCFRMIYRCNGAPKAETPLTIKNSTKTRSPYITLAARA